MQWLRRIRDFKHVLHSIYGYLKKRLQLLEWLDSYCLHPSPQQCLLLRTKLRSRPKHQSNGHPSDPPKRGDSHKY